MKGILFLKSVILIYVLKAGLKSISSGEPCTEKDSYDWIHYFPCGIFCVASKVIGAVFLMPVPGFFFPFSQPCSSEGE